MTSLQSLLDEIIRRYADYYGFTWKGFRVTEVTKFYSDQAFRNGRLITLTVLYVPMTLWLGYNLLRKFRISSVALVLLLPCLLVLMNGFTPDRFAFIRIILLFAVIEQGTFYYSATQKSSLVFRNCMLKKGALSDIITLYVYL